MEYRGPDARAIKDLVDKHVAERTSELRQQLAECERERDSLLGAYSEARGTMFSPATNADLQKQLATVTAERNAFQDQCISLKMKMTMMREERDKALQDFKDVHEDYQSLGKELRKVAMERDSLRQQLAECHFKREEAGERFSKAYGLLITERDSLKEALK